MELSVIFTTYNAPEWLEKVLYGYKVQQFRDFELLIADDGSGPETATVIKSMEEKVDFPVKHIWQEDNGFRKCAILNKAISEAQTDYLVFTDGDCIPHSHFIQTHAQKKEKGYFLSGGYYKLPMDISKAIQKEDIESGRCFDLKWLRKQGLPASFKNSKLLFNKTFSTIMNAATPTHASWNGHNASGWKSDILAVNGYDERMRYGALDRELGERLMNNGIKGKQIRYSAICLHLDHSRGYVNQQDLDNNAAIRKSTQEQKKTWTEFGIKK